MTSLYLFVDVVVHAENTLCVENIQSIQWTPECTIYWKLMKTILIGTKNSLIRTSRIDQSNNENFKMLYQISHGLTP